MTKRFTYVKNNSITQYQALPIQEIGKGKAFHCQGIVDKLNKLSDENEQLKSENQSWLKTASRMDTIHHEDREYCERIHRENEKLKQENQQYKSLLRDMGLLRSGEDVMAIRNNFADKIIKPIFAESGFDVDVDTSNGFAISLKEEKE